MTTLPATRTASVSGRTLAWREQGDGVALVLIHGIGGSSESWAQQFADFSRKYQVFAWDAPGYGGSEPFPQDAPTAEDYAAALAALIDMRGVITAHVVGHSIGAVIAAALCRHIPATVQSLTLVHPLIGGGALDAAGRAAARKARMQPIEELGMAEFAKCRGPSILGPRAPAAMVDEVTSIMGAVKERSYRQLVEVIVSSDMMALAPTLDVPTLVIAGDADPVAPVASCRALAEALPDATLEIFEGVGHYAPREDAPRLRDTLTRFLAAYDESAAAATY
jgi:pimeloyl-ACP methyl ester carboxylesterase